LFGLARLALADQPRAMGFPGRAQVGPVARLHWSDRCIARSMDGFDAAGALEAHLKLDRQVMDALRKTKASVVPA